MLFGIFNSLYHKLNHVLIVNIVSVIKRILPWRKKEKLKELKQNGE